MIVSPVRVVFAAVCLGVLVPVGPASAGPPGSPGYCPGDGLMHDWDTGQPFAPCPIGGGLVSTSKGNVWVDKHGDVHQAPTPQQPDMNGQLPDVTENGDSPNPRPRQVQPGESPPWPNGNAGSIGGPP